MYPAARILERAVRFFPDREALVDGDVRLTYRQLGDRVARLANGLKALGLQSGDRVAILDWNSHRYAEAYYACALAGLTFMPLNSRLAAPELEYIFDDSDARALLLSEPFLELYGQIRDKEIVFRPPDGRDKLILTPEKVVQTQFRLGADVMVALDDCTGPAQMPTSAAAPT